MTGDDWVDLFLFAIHLKTYKKKTRKYYSLIIAVLYYVTRSRYE